MTLIINVNDAFLNKDTVTVWSDKSLMRRNKVKCLIFAIY